MDRFKELSTRKKNLPGPAEIKEMDNHGNSQCGECDEELRVKKSHFPELFIISRPSLFLSRTFLSHILTKIISFANVKPCPMKTSFSCLTNRCIFCPNPDIEWPGLNDSGLEIFVILVNGKSLALASNWQIIKHWSGQLKDFFNVETSPDSRVENV